VRALHDQYGWDIGAHATTGLKHGQSLTGMTQAERLAELAAIRKWLAELGVEGLTLAYPIGRHDLAAETDVARFFSTGRQATMQHVTPQYPGNAFGLDSLNAGTQYGQLAARLTRVVAAKGWMSITLHAIKEASDPTRTGNDITPAQLAQMLADIAASGVEVLPMGDVVRSLA
jgi:hypothetical protein